MPRAWQLRAADHTPPASGGSFAPRAVSPVLLGAAWPRVDGNRADSS